MQSFGAVSQAHGMLDAKEGGGLFLEPLDVGAENKLGRLQRIENGLVYLALDFVVLPLQINHGYGHILLL